MIKFGIFIRSSGPEGDPVIDIERAVLFDEGTIFNQVSGMIPAAGFSIEGTTEAIDEEMFEAEAVLTGKAEDTDSAAVSEDIRSRAIISNELTDIFGTGKPEIIQENVITIFDPDTSADKGTGWIVDSNTEILKGDTITGIQPEDFA